MNNILNKSMVLVLTRNWQAANVRTPQEAFGMLATNVATGLEIEGESHIRPVRRAAMLELARGWKDDPDTLLWLKTRAQQDEDNDVWRP